jgi:sulfide:quinone oxidoreductase
MAARVLIAGGGVAALEAALALQTLVPGQADVELLAPEPEFWYRPLSVAEPFGLGESKHFDLSQLAARAGAVFTPGTLHGADASRSEALTSHGAIGYDFLLVATGTIPTVAVEGALTFRGPADTEKVRRLLQELSAGDIRRITFVVPWGAVWSVPLYELALLTATYAEREAPGQAQLELVTPEEEPLQIFGRAASTEMRRLLDERGIELHAGVSATGVANGELRLIPDGRLRAERVVALPRLRGAALDGIPQTVAGFIPVDAHGEVHGLIDVFAAGDITSFPVKQGGLATQQADAAAEEIASRLGADLQPQPFRPVLRGLILTGSEARFLRRDVTDGAEQVSLEPLWWPPSKIVGRYLAPFLAELAGVEGPPESEAPPGAVPVEVELDETDPAIALAAVPPSVDADGPVARDAMTADPIVVAPEDTLGEIAARLRDADVGSAAVSDYGRLIGILTSRDLLRAFAGRAHPSEARAREWMTAEPVTVTLDTPVATAVTLMTEYEIHHLPVVEGERVVGMLGLRQAARLLNPASGVGLGL